MSNIPRITKKLYMVLKPTENSEFTDILTTITLDELSLMRIGGLRESNIEIITPNLDLAVIHAKELLPNKVFNKKEFNEIF